MSVVVFIFLIILISFVAISEIKERNKKIKQLEKDWKFCKGLLDKERAKNK